VSKPDFCGYSEESLTSIGRCPKCGGTDYPMSVTQDPRGLRAPEYHRNRVRRAFQPASFLKNRLASALLLCTCLALLTGIIYQQKVIDEQRSMIRRLSQDAVHCSADGS
jgi:hypothetical protein